MIWGAEFDAPRRPGTTADRCHHVRPGLAGTRRQYSVSRPTGLGGVQTTVPVELSTVMPSGFTTKSQVTGSPLASVARALYTYGSCALADLRGVDTMCGGLLWPSGRTVTSSRPVASPPRPSSTMMSTVCDPLDLRWGPLNGPCLPIDGHAFRRVDQVIGRDDRRPYRSPIRSGQRAVQPSPRQVGAGPQAGARSVRRS